MGGPALIFKVKGFKPGLTSSMILGLSETARLFYKYYIDLELWLLENHKCYKVAFLNTCNSRNSGPSPCPHFQSEGVLTYFNIKYNTWSVRNCPDL